MAPKTSNPAGSARRKRPPSLVISPNGLIMTSTEYNRYSRQYKGLSKGQRRRAKARSYGVAALTGSTALADKSMLKSASRYTAKNTARRKKAAAGAGGRRRQRRDRKGRFS